MEEGSRKDDGSKGGNGSSTVELTGSEEGGRSETVGRVGIDVAGHSHFSIIVHRHIHDDRGGRSGRSHSTARLRLGVDSGRDELTLGRSRTL